MGRWQRAVTKYEWRGGGAGGGDLRPPSRGEIGIRAGVSGGVAACNVFADWRACCTGSFISCFVCWNVLGSTWAEQHPSAQLSFIADFLRAQYEFLSCCFCAALLIWNWSQPRLPHALPFCDRQTSGVQHHCMFSTKRVWIWRAEGGENNKTFDSSLLDLFFRNVTMLLPSVNNQFNRIEN